MAYPAGPTIQTSYTAFQASQGDNSFPGVPLDTDLANLRATLEAWIAFQKRIQRADGALANRTVATSADFGARQTLYAVSQDLPGDSFIGPKYSMRGPTTRVARGPLARSAAKATALWELSEQLTETEFPL